MSNIDLRDAVNSWVAQELEDTRTSGVSYWVMLHVNYRDPLSLPRVIVFAVHEEQWASAFVQWPPDEARTGVAVLSIIRELFPAEGVPASG